jgi:hypothetical protein
VQAGVQETLRNLDSSSRRNDELSISDAYLRGVVLRSKIYAVRSLMRKPVDYRGYPLVLAAPPCRVVCRPAEQISQVTRLWGTLTQAFPGAHISVFLHLEVERDFTACFPDESRGVLYRSSLFGACGRSLPSACFRPAGRFGLIELPEDFRS